MRVIIAGCSGLIGRYLVRERPPDITIIGATRNNPHDKDLDAWFRTDLTNLNEVRRLIKKISPDLIIHAAGESRVDFVEENPVLAKESIIDSTVNLLETASSHSVPILYVSSNAVFGASDTPYCVGDDYSPINQYGELKVQAERLMISYENYGYIVRPLLTYGWTSKSQRPCVIEQWRKSLLGKKEIRAITDVTNQPLYAVECASRIWKMALQKKIRVANIGGPEELSMYSFAQILAQNIGVPENLVIPVTSAELGLPASRPKRIAYKEEFENELFPGTRIKPSKGISLMMKSKNLSERN